VHAFRESDDVGVKINNSVMDVDGHVIATAMDGRVRIAGIAEFADADSQPRSACGATHIKDTMTELVNNQRKIIFKNIF